MILNEKSMLVHLTWEWNEGKSYEDDGYADHRDRVQGPVVELKGMGEWLLGEKRGVVSNTGIKFGGIFKVGEEAS